MKCRILNLFLILLAVYLPISSTHADDTKSAAIFTKVLPFAELANAIYEEKNLLVNIAQQHELKLNDVDNIAGVEVSYALLTDVLKKQHVVVIRGTANVENAIADMDIKLLKDAQSGVLLHQGFLSASTPILQKLEKSLDKEFDILITGHSLGGAVAVILAMQLDNNDFKVNKVITFGQPKVTNIEGANRYKHLNVTRLVRPKDLVPIVPPVDPMDLKNMDIYWHLGKELILLDSNEYAELEGLKSMLRGGDFLTIAPSEENLESHKMTGYLALIKNNSLKTEKVEYKSSFNPLSLFGGN